MLYLYKNAAFYRLLDTIAALYIWAELNTSKKNTFFTVETFPYFVSVKSKKRL